MDNFVSINKTKENIITFDISIQGLTTDDIRVWFSIKAGPIEVNVPCIRKDGDTWEATIPPLQFIEMTAYPCSVCLVADGYYFEPMTGTVDVVGSAQVYTSNANNTSFAPKAPAAPEGTIKQSDLRDAAQRSEVPAHAATGAKFDFGSANRSVREARDPRSTSVNRILAESASTAKKPTATASRVTRTPAQIAADLMRDTTAKPSVINEAIEAAQPVDPKKQKVDDILGSLGINIPEPVAKARFSTKKK